MASLLRAAQFSVFMAALSVLLLHDVAAGELAQTAGPVMTSSVGREDGVSDGNVNWRRFFSRRVLEDNEVRGVCEYEPRYITYCCHINGQVPLCYYSKYDCINNCITEAPPAKH